MPKIIRTSVLGLALPIALNVCATDAAPGNTAAPAPPRPAAESCDAGAAQTVVGKPNAPDIVEQARKAAGAEVARVLKPGQVVTMEYRTGRLNIDIDEQGVIVAVRCG